MCHRGESRSEQRRSSVLHSGGGSCEGSETALGKGINSDKEAVIDRLSRLENGGRVAGKTLEEHCSVEKTGRLMKVLMVNKFHHLVGGSDTYYFSVGESLEAMGHEVAWFSMQDSANLPCKESKYFVRPKNFRGGSSPLLQIRDGLALVYSWEAKRNFEQLLRDFRPDVIHLNLVHRHITFSILDAPSIEGIPVVYTAHDYFPVCPSCIMIDGSGNVCDECLDGDFKHCIERRCVKASMAKSALAMIEAFFLKEHQTYSKIDRIIAPSEFLRAKLLEGGFPSGQVVHMQNFAKEELIEKARAAKCVPREKTILYFGRLSHEKGIDIAVAAFAAASKFIPREWKLIIAGDGAEREVIERLVSECGLADRVELTGFLDRDEMQRHVERTSLAIASSRCRENMPYSIIEAFAAGTPVIGSRIGGIPEVVLDGETGFLCEPEDVESTALAIIKGVSFVDDNPREHELMQQRCRTYVVEHCNQEEYMGKLVDLYEKLIEARH